MPYKEPELCGTCRMNYIAIRKKFGESLLCACGAPFFSQLVAEQNLPADRRCLIVSIEWFLV